VVLSRVRRVQWLGVPLADWCNADAIFGFSVKWDSNETLADPSAVGGGLAVEHERGSVMLQGMNVIAGLLMPEGGGAGRGAPRPPPSGGGGRRGT